MATSQQQQLGKTLSCGSNDLSRDAGMSANEVISTSEQPESNPSNAINAHHKVGLSSSTMTETRIVYHVDDEETPYLVKLPIPHNQIRLSDFKGAISLPRPRYKFFFKSFDKEVGVVKEEIIDDNSLLPIVKDRVVAWLVSTEGSTVSDSTNSQCLTEISANGRLTSNRSIQSNENRHGLVNDSHPSYLGQTNDHFSQVTTTETESMISSCHRRNYPNSKRNFNYKNGHNYPGKHHGSRYGHGNGHSYYGHGHHYMDSSVVTSDMESTSYVDSDDDDDDLIDTGVDEDNDYDDYNSRVSTTTEETSVSRQYLRRSKKRRKGYFQRQRMSRTSSLSSITESSMSLNVFQVTLNLDRGSYLGISLVGQTSKKGDGGIYVSSILKGGVVALDGRIEPGDMILQVNEINLENLTNDEAVDVIREAVKKPGPIKLLVAKCWDSHPKGHFTIPRSEPVRPIDPGAWVAHTEAARAKFSNPDNYPGQQSNLKSFNETTPMVAYSEQDRQIFEQPFSSYLSNSYPLSNAGVINPSLIPGSPFRNSMKSNPSVIVPPSCITSIQVPSPQLTIESSLEGIAYAMANPNSGLDVKDRMWLKIRIPNAFIGSDVVDWLYANIQGINERKDAKKIASKLLKGNFICHTINLKSSFSEKCYYVFSEQLQQINKSIGGDALMNSNDFNLQTISSTTQSLPPNFDENFTNTLRLSAKDQFEGESERIVPSLSDHLKTRAKFMAYWDEKSEIRNYGLFGPQPENSSQRNDETSTNSGGNRSFEQHQSDEGMSQQSGQSILYRPQMISNSTASAAISHQLQHHHHHHHHTNTINSSGSNGSSQHMIDNNQITGLPTTAAPNSNGNLINHHYEDLQINPNTGGLIPSSMPTERANLNGNFFKSINQQQFTTAAGATTGNNNSSLFQNQPKTTERFEDQGDQFENLNNNNKGHVFLSSKNDETYSCRQPSTLVDLVDDDKKSGGVTRNNDASHGKKDQ